METQVIVKTENLAEVNSLLANGFKVLSMLTADLILLSGASQVLATNSNVSETQLQG